MACKMSSDIGKKFGDKDLLHIELEENAIQIKEIYNKFYNILKNMPKCKDKNITGASKAMHLLFPRIFVMWDRDIREDLGFDKKTNSDGYLEFLNEMQKEADEVIDSYHRDKNIHKEMVEKLISKTIWGNETRTLAKMIDECNFAKAHLETNTP
jgi:GH25 family lysozyme M1 (1,4-beta-N-acetylmuramidase)